MTEDEAFKILAVEGLGGFGWSLTAEEIPTIHDISTVLNRIITWWNSLDQHTYEIIGGFDLALPMWNLGWFYEWPALYQLLAGNPFGEFFNSFENMRLSLSNAQSRAAEYAAQHAVGKLEDDPALQGGQAAGA